MMDYSYSLASFQEELGEHFLGFLKIYNLFLTYVSENLAHKFAKQAPEKANVPSST